MDKNYFFLRLKTNPANPKNKKKNPQFEIQPIAFGLKAIIVMLGWLKDKELDNSETQLKKISAVSSVQIIDIRRAIG